MDCPYCRETIEDEDAVDCPECGEALDEDDNAPPSGDSSKIVIVVVVVFVVGIMGCGVLAALLMPALMKAKSKASLTKCSNNLRQLGLAGLQYSDDKRFFPHVGKLVELDGDVDSNHGPKVFRTFVYYGYHDNPEGFICPESYDAFIPSSNSDRQWFWDGGTNPASRGQCPLVDGAPDPALSATTELSYGWTRKGMNSNVRSNVVIAADRAVRDDSDPTSIMGNHQDGWNILRADATVMYEFTGMSPFPGSWLTATRSKGNQPGGYLGIKVQDDPTIFR